MKPEPAGKNSIKYFTVGLKSKLSQFLEVNTCKRDLYGFFEAIQQKNIF